MKRVSDFPSSIALNGADFFLLQLDRMMWQSSRCRNICTFVVRLDARLECRELASYLSTNAAYQWICRLRLQKTWPFVLAKWVFNADIVLPAIDEYQGEQGDTLPSDLLQKPFNIEKQAAFRISLVQLKDGGSQLVFTWHHALMDAHGGEIFIRQLGGEETISPADWFSHNPVSALSLRARADIALQMKAFLCHVSRLPFISLIGKKKRQQAVLYHTLKFSQRQTQQMAVRARDQGAGFLVSAFYLAVTSYAVAKVQHSRMPLDSDMLVPIPLDCRKRGVQAPVIGNQVTFLFYRIPLAALANIKTCVSALMAQMKDLMRSENPQHYLIMMDFLRRVPGWLYRMQLTSPTKGKMASFHYSDTGDSLDLYAQLFGRSVSSVIHYPPNMYPPGLTFVFSRYQGALQLTLGYMESVLTADELALLLSELQLGLLGEAGL